MKQSRIDAETDTVLGVDNPVGKKVSEEMDIGIKSEKYRRSKRYFTVLLIALLGLIVCLLVAYIDYPTNDELDVYVKSVKKSKSKSSRPHVVFLLADDYGYNDIGYHGSKIRTPVMDNLAKDGVILENYYVQPKCSPTRSQLLSGRYQIHTGLQHGTIKAGVPNCLPLDEETLPQSLKKLGYATHMVGKWHLGFYRKACLPTRRGFDSFFGLLLGSGGHWSHEYLNGYDFRVNDNVARQYKNKYSTTLFAKQARKIIMSHEPDKPLFLYVPFQAPHTPLEVPARYSLPYKNVFHDRNRQIYAGMVACLDEAVGNITAALKEKGIYDNSVIIFSTDNGAQVHSSGGSNWPLRGMKGTLWEGGIRGVGFVHSRLLSKSVRGTVNRQLFHVSDWFPTIVEGISKGKYRGSKPLDGYNIWESIRHNKPSPRKEILHNIDSLRLPLTPKDRWSKESIKKIFDVGQRAAIRQGDWKLITGTSNRYGWYAPPGSYQKSVIPERSSRKVVWLFNITADPYEKSDLSDKHTDVVMKLLRKLSKYNTTAVHPKYPSPDPAADPSKHGGVWGPWARRPPKGFKGIYGPVCSKGHTASCVKSLRDINNDINNYDAIIKEVMKQESVEPAKALKLKSKTDVKKLKPKENTKVKIQHSTLKHKTKVQPKIKRLPKIKRPSRTKRPPVEKYVKKTKYSPKDKSKKVESKEDESDKDESKKVESKKVESKKVESKKVESKKVESKKDESKKIESKKVESKKNKSRKDESKKDESKKVESDKVESKKVESKKDESKKVESKKVESNKDKSKKDESKKVESDKVESKKVKSKKDESKKIESKKVESKKVESKKEESKKVESKKDESKKDKSKKVESKKDGRNINKNTKKKNKRS